MPYSYHFFKSEIRQFILNNFKRSTTILDVGPGCGTYSRLLPEYSMDCVEIYEPNVKKFNLSAYYKKIHIGNVVDFNFSSYDLLIFGDVFEHLSIADSKKVLKNANIVQQKCIISVPYTYEQGPVDGNIYETHLQPDLTVEVMKSRYSELQFLFGNNKMGYYINF